MSDPAPSERRHGPDIMWAPWRMAYITSEHDHGFEGDRCVFCALPKQEDDAATYILHRGRHCFVVMNLYPYNNGHTMVVPYAHIDALPLLEPAVTAELMALAQRTQTIIAEHMRPQGFNIGINQGSAAGAGIAEHMHLHVVPRWAGDTNFITTIGDTRVLPQHLDDTYELLKQGFNE